MAASIREWRHEGVDDERAQRAALFAILDQLKAGGRRRGDGLTRRARTQLH